MRAPMAPCSSCHRHLRVSEAVCPFCGTAQASVEAPAEANASGRGKLGGLALAAAITVLGTSACTGQPGADAGDGMTTTTNGSSSDSSSDSVATTTDTETTAMTDVTDDNDSVDDNDDVPLSFYACSDPYDYGPSECDPFAQDCPEGEKCVPYSSVGGDAPDANKCVPITGSGSAGDPCVWGGPVEATDDCDQDHYCWHIQEDEGMAVGVCTPFCGGTPDDPICEPGTACLINWDGSATLCLSACDPLMQDCPAGQVCGWANSDFMCLTPLGLPTPPFAGLGEPCGLLGSCEPALECVAAQLLPDCDGSACCTEYCNLDAPTCTNPDTSCVAFFDEGEELPGHENVGVCLLDAP